MHSPVASDLFSESTLGVPSKSSDDNDIESLPEVKLWKTLFQTPKFRIRVVLDVEGVCLSGGLKSAFLILILFFLCGSANLRYQMLSRSLQDVSMASDGAPMPKVCGVLEKI